MLVQCEMMHTPGRNADIRPDILLDRINPERKTRCGEMPMSSLADAAVLLLHLRPRSIDAAMHEPP